jgi:lysophospholipase L1-like esterase
MRPAKKVAATAVLGASATLSGAYGFLIGEALMARRAIGTTQERPPSPDGVYGDDLPGQPIRVLVIGDSAAVGYGMKRADATPAGMIGIGLTHLMDAPVEVRMRAVVGAQTSDLMGQIEQVGDWTPDVTVIVVGTNDVTHQVPPSSSARQLGDVVRHLIDAGSEVVVGTAPDLGSVRPIKQPLRAVAQQWSRRLARLQTIAVVEAGGRAVSLGSLLGPLFTENRDLMFGVDRFHPSETGYANMVSVLIPGVAASLRERTLATELAGYAPDRTPRNLMSVRDAAAEAAQNPGTEVVQDKAQGGGRWANVLRRRFRP